MIPDPELQQKVIDTLLPTLQDLDPTVCRTAAIAIDHLETQHWHLQEIRQSLQEEDAGDFASPEEVSAVFTKLTQGRL
jgi:predicted transcriptional regulator